MLTVQTPPNQSAAPAARPHPKPPKCGPKCRQFIRGLEQQQLAAYLNAVWLGSMGLPPSPQIQSVMDCIKGVESGNYAEASHIYEGSGAFQFIPTTWQHWYGLWRDAVEFRHADYPYAYLAPPLIQDAVLVYTLTHGGASNWSGVDGCTGH